MVKGDGQPAHSPADSQRLTRATTELEELAAGVLDLRDQIPELTESATRLQLRTCGCKTLMHVAA